MQHIQCNSEAFLKPVKIVNGIVERRQTMPILSNVLIDQKDENVNIFATDLDIQIKSSAPIGISGQEGKFTVSANKLNDILSAISSNTEITVEHNEQKVEIKTPKFQSSIQTMPHEDFPLINPLQFDIALKLPSNQLKYLFSMVQFSMAVQDVRYYLNGMLLVVDGNLIRTVATDTYRLACCEATIENLDIKKPIEAIIPRKTIQQLLRVLPDSEDEITLEFSKTHMRVTFENIEFISKLIEGKYPDYKRVLPNHESSNLSSTLIDREELMSALRRVAILANDKFKGVRWTLDNNTLEIQSNNTEQEEANETIQVSWQFDTLEMGLNINYLLDILSNLKNKEVRFSFNNSSAGVLITMPESYNFRYIVMPLRI